MAFVVLTKCFNEPKYFLRLLTVIVCLCVASYQLSASIRKILNPPISTHYMFQLNESMSYPSITICRNPAYKTSVFAKYGLPIASLHYSATWKDFKFDEFTLDEFFAEATYELKDVIPFYGFRGYKANVQVEEYLKLLFGRCFKMSPLNVTLSYESNGYMFYMKHNASARYDRYDPVENFFRMTEPNSVRTSLAGYHVYLHQPKERITDQPFQTESFMEYIYVEVGEDLSYNMRTNEYNQLSTSNNNCSTSYGYSRTMCIENCLHKRVTESVGCSTPWMENENLPRCDNYDKVKSIIMLYQSYSKEENDRACGCVRSCNITIYIPYVQNRKSINPPTSIFLVYYTSNLVTVMEEVIGYDWNLFLADLGGSLGFLLGLSVLGVIGVLEQIIKLICLKKPKIEEPHGTETNEKVEIYLNGNKIEEEDYTKY